MLCGRRAAGVVSMRACSAQYGAIASSRRAAVQSPPGASAASAAAVSFRASATRSACSSFRIRAANARGSAQTGGGPSVSATAARASTARA